MEYMSAREEAKNILVFLSENLGARTLKPLVEQLAQENNVTIINDHFCSHVLDQLGIDYTLVEPEDLPAHVREADLILSGKTYMRETENRLMRLAQVYQTPYVIVLGDIGGEIAEAKFRKRDEDSKRLLPTYIFVADPITRTNMIARGMPEKKLLAGGSPHFDTVLERIRKMRKEQYKPCPRVTYMDVIFESDYQRGILPSGPYGQRAFIDDVISAMEAIPGVHLHLKLHPESDPHDFDGLRVLTEKDALKVIMQSDVVVSAYSTTLFDAYLAGVPAVSYQPWSANIRQDVFAGRIPIVKTTQELTDAVQHALKEKPALAHDEVFFNQGFAAQYLASAIHQILHQPQKVKHKNIY